LEIAQDLWNDPTWTRAVFLRDPAERLLSAYLDKFVKNAYTQRIFKIGNLTDPNRPRLTFGEFADLVAVNNTRCAIPTGLHTCSDPHWKPQYLTCGLDVTLPLVDFVGNFNHLAEHTRMLLERVDMWESYGKLFDDGSSSTSNNSTPSKATALGCSVPPPALSTNSSPVSWGFNQRGPSQEQTHQHSTGSQEKMDKYYTPEIMAKVRKAYDVDFALWDDLSSRSVKDVPRGRDLQHVQSYCRRRGIDLSKII
jgi:Sulfotransferase family